MKPGDSLAFPTRVLYLRPHTTPANSQKRSPRWWRLRLEGSTTLQEALQWKGKELYLPRFYLPPLEGDSFYYVETIGAQVKDIKGTFTGKLRTIYPGVSYDFFIAEDAEGNAYWIPAPFVLNLDRAVSPPVLWVDAPPGLWDPTLSQGKA